MIVLAFALVLQQASVTPSPRTVEIAPGAPSSAAIPGSVSEQVRPGDRLICRTEPVLGSNRRERICMTAAQRERMRENSRDFREGMDRQTNPNLTSSGGSGN
ncbi:hypothetical protein [Brevundimonas nasdae]|jgi:hypothetical protein|uniref:hypothetical protein n=1 Tax=Brevundimonas nasdae TaxID=172043 RepID=UPI00289D5124|nr:hypothetical protein [Brevundimonas nasdae]